MTLAKASSHLPQARVPKRKRGHDRVTALMAAGIAAFLEKGFDATTMTAIAARAGASIGSLYLFFPTKQALAQAILADHAEILSARFDVLRERIAGTAPAAIADAVFATFGGFLLEHPVYGTLLDLPGDAAWRRSVRLRRRSQIAALFALATPALPPAQADRLAIIVPHLLRIPLALDEERAMRDEVLDELRVMLRLHLQSGGCVSSA